MRKCWVLAAALWAAASAGDAVAGDVTVPEEYGKFIKQHSRIGTLGDDAFGDRVGLSTGSLEIVQTDVALPGNNALPVRMGRRFVVSGENRGYGHIGYWDLDIPHLHGIFYTGLGWTVAGNGDQRCSHFAEPPEVMVQYGVFSADEYWHGNSLYLPGSGDSELLLAGAVADVPTDGSTYPVVTRDGAVARCLPSLAATSEAGSQGEGFEVVTPDGTVYRFDQMVSRLVDRLTKPDAAPASFTSTNTSTSTQRKTGSSAGTMTTQAATSYYLPRSEVILYPTRITDRYGNTVTYTWDAGNPWRLLRIAASDGRQLDFTYPAADPDSYQIQSVSDGTRTWTYTSTTVTQPDSGVWQLNVSNLHNAQAKPTWVMCDQIDSPGQTYTGTITAPSGATVHYTLADTVFGRSMVWRQCTLPYSGDIKVAAEPYLFNSVALTGKTITGPGLPAGGLTWSYDYGTPNQCWDPASVSGSLPPGGVACSASSPKTRTTTVTAPDGSVSRHVFGNEYRQNEGLLLREESGWNGSNALRTVAITYADPEAAPYFAYHGISRRHRGDYDITSMRRPKRRVVTSQQGVDFTWEVASGCVEGPYCFDFRARPTEVVRSGINTPVATQNEQTVFYDDPVRWILGQVKLRTVDGLLAAQTDFDAASRPLRVKAFGKLRQTLTYHADGTLASVADGNGNATTYDSWKRGIPTAIGFPATPESPSGATRTAVVSDEGWITSVTDESGATTGYAYDAMGRITQITYPAGDPQAWTPTLSVFAPVATVEHGIAAGHWRQTTHTGDGYKVTYFDALWRPVLVHEYDAGASGTDRWTATAYDGMGSVADVAYPLASAPTMTTAGTWLTGAARPSGVRTYYDDLGRVTTVQQDSELGVLTSATEYLGGFMRRTTDARLNSTTEQFMAWDTPSYDWPIQVDAPEGQRTTIARDPFGKPIAITRGGVQ